MRTWIVRSYYGWRVAHALYSTRVRFRSANHLPPYPSDLNLELTTYCNNHCLFCTHDRLMQSKQRKQMHMPIEQAKYALDKMRMMTQTEQVNIGLVGLGESLLYPDLFEVLTYARSLFPQSHIGLNTNGLLLTSEIGQNLINSSLDKLRVSLDYATPETYRQYCGVDGYDVVVKNTRAFLKLKGNRKPVVAIHIFSHPANRGCEARFFKEWKPFLNDDDTCMIEKYLPFTKDKTTLRHKRTCNQIRQIMMVSVEGYVYPCCLGVWMPHDNELALGHISENTNDLLLRYKQILTILPKVCDNCVG